ncbi:amidohydrolase [uncultured Algimonas sp.]|uniref:amidohydrolase n=1 Tax=uncultured Algimonas sp. TaxID=1547920 RepID=UPI0026030826|nr:amidohydrolase [uncultured Algimonas sp.]
MRRAAIAALALLLTGGCGTGVLTPDTRIIVGATFVTMEDGPAPEAMLIEDGRIAALGSADALRARNPGAVLTDLTGRTVIPGIVDSHAHVAELGLDAAKVDLVGVATVEGMVARIRAQRPEADPGAWILGQGWDEGAFADADGPGGYPTTEALTTAFPDTPVVLESLHGFALMANAAALAKAGITAATPDPEGGTILRDEDGQPTGVLLALAQKAALDAVPKPEPDRVEAAILDGLQRLAAAGVTSVHEVGMDDMSVAAFTALAEASDLPIRVYGLLDGNDATLMEDWFARGPLDDPDDRLDIRGIKIFYDGSLGSRTALMEAPYTDRPEAARPVARISMARVEELSKRARDTGFQMAVHAIGDAATDNVLRSYERRLATEDGQVADHRWRIEHAQVFRPDFPERAKALGVIASMQPSHALGDSNWAEDRIGSRRIRRAYAWRTLHEAGVPLILNSDLPGEPWMPMQTLHFATTRTRLDGTPEGGWYLGQALDPETVLRAMTFEGARAAFQEEAIGSLALGKWADFVVLSGNPLTQDPRTITIEATYVAGRTVFDRNAAGESAIQAR